MACEIFISYATPDRKIADKVCQVLEQRGLSCWIAPRDEQPNANVISEAIREAHLLLLMFSSNANTYPNVMRELDRAVQARLPVIAFRLENVAPTENIIYYSSYFEWHDAYEPPVEKHISGLCDLVSTRLTEIRGDNEIVNLNLTGVWNEPHKKEPPKTKEETAVERIRGLFKQAQALCRDSRFSEAWGFLEEIYDSVPDSRRLLYQRAICLNGLQRFDEALEHCEKLEGRISDTHIKALRDKILADQRTAAWNEEPPHPIAIFDEEPDEETEEETEPVEVLDVGLVHEVELFFNKRLFDNAKIVLAKRLRANPANLTAHYLCARLFLSNSPEHRNLAKAVRHAKRAIELGGENSPPILETLAEALGGTGEAEHGFHFLERAYTLAEDASSRTALEERIHSYRAQHKLAIMWQFVNEAGDIVFEGSDIEQICRAILREIIPEGARCRKNKVGEWKPIKESLALENKAVAAVYHKPLSYIVTMAPGFGIISIALAVVAIVLYQGFVLNLKIVLPICMFTGIIGGGIGLLMGTVLDNARN